MSPDNKSTFDDCKCDTCIKVRQNVKKIFRVIDIYSWLLDSYIVDFFLEDLWNKLPPVWKNTLDFVTPEELGEWILGESCKRVWPLSLIALRQVIQDLEINRNHNEREVIKCRRRENREVTDPGSLTMTEIHSANSISYLNNPKFNKLFLKHVKTKKRYEIEKMAQIISECTLKTNCNIALDIGAGVGHLSRVLAFKYGLNVICVEQDSILTGQAVKYDQELQTNLQKYNSIGEEKIHHVSMTIKANDSGEEILDYLTKNIANLQTNLPDKGFGIIGLHPCGDLASTLLKLYSFCEKAKFICVVGCCYMKLTLSKEDGNNFNGYPMSLHISTISNNKLSFNALEVACHAVEKHCEKLKSGNHADLVVHTYRSALEYILVQKSCKLRRIQVKNMKVKDGMSFEQLSNKYCISATENLKPEDRPEFSDFAQLKIGEFLQNWKRVLIFGSLRLMLAPLVETCVLLDRFLFLSEKGLVPSLKAEFDCKISPRNFVLISTK